MTILYATHKIETAMTAPIQTATMRTEVIRDPKVMGGEPVVRGTRILAMTIMSYLQSDEPVTEIFRDYPSLPVDGVDAVVRWAEDAFGPEWKSPKTPALRD